MLDIDTNKTNNIEKSNSNDIEEKHLIELNLRKSISDNLDSIFNHTLIISDNYLLSKVNSELELSMTDLITHPKLKGVERELLMELVQSKTQLKTYSDLETLRLQLHVPRDILILRRLPTSLGQHQVHGALINILSDLGLKLISLKEELNDNWVLKLEGEEAAKQAFQALKGGLLGHPVKPELKTNTLFRTTNYYQRTEKKDPNFLKVIPMADILGFEKGPESTPALHEVHSNPKHATKEQHKPATKIGVAEAYKLVQVMQKAKDTLLPKAYKPQVEAGSLFRSPCFSEELDAAHVQRICLSPTEPSDQVKEAKSALKIQTYNTATKDNSETIYHYKNYDSRYRNNYYKIDNDNQNYNQNSQNNYYNNSKSQNNNYQKDSQGHKNSQQKHSYDRGYNNYNRRKDKEYRRNDRVSNRDKERERDRDRDYQNIEYNKDKNQNVISQNLKF